MLPLSDRIMRGMPNLWIQVSIRAVAQAIVDASGKEYIIEVNDCAMGLLGDGQDEDRRLIAEIVLNTMEVSAR